MAYPVSNDFKTKLYSGESDFRAILTINGATIPEEQIASISISSPIIDNTNSMFYMGSFISQKITIHFNNMEGINVASGQEVSLTIGQYVNNAWEDVPIGVFLVDDLSEDYYQKCEINCLDYAIKFKPNIDYSPCFTDGKATIDTILAYICNYFNVTLGDYPTINGDVEIGTYDASVSGKQWISYIAEIKGCNAKMDRTGALTLKPIKSTSVETIDATSGSELTLGEAYNISGVCYYDAIRKYEYGNDSGNTLYIRQDNPFINESVVANIYEQMLTQPSSSEKTNFDLSGLSSLPISVGEIKGDTYQEQVEASRNILRIANTNSYVSNGITSTYNNGEVTFSGTATSNLAYLCDYNDVSLPAAQYTFSITPSGNNFAIRLNVKYEDNSTATQSISSSGIKKTFTTTKAIKQYRLSIGSITSGTSYSATFKLQLEQNSTYTDWVEPRDASPSPSNPSEIQVVTGDNDVVIANSQLLKRTNEGIYDWANAPGNGTSSIASQIFNDVPTVNNQNGVRWTKTTTSTNWQYLGFYQNDFRQLLYDSPQETKFTISFDIRVDTTTNQVLRVTFVQGNAQHTLLAFPDYTSGFIANEWKHIELTGVRNAETTLGNQLLYFYTYLLQQDVSQIDIVNVKIEHGQNASPYEPYTSQSYNVNLGSIELNKIGTYQDYIYKDSGKWYLHKEVGKVVLNGSENWQIFNTNMYLYMPDFILSAGNNDYVPTNFIADHFTPNSLTNSSANLNASYMIQNVWGSRNNQRGVAIKTNDTFTDLATLKTWLNTHNTNVYYVLATPTYTKITNTELLEQLENIQNISPYNGYANISITTSNLTPTLKLNYTTSDNLDLQSLTTRNIGDFSLDAWDTITYDVDGTTYKALNNNEIIYEQNVMGTVNPKFPTGQQEETTNVVEESVNSLKLKVSTEIDNVNGAIALKVDKDGVINSINLSTEGTQINGGKISLAGKTIEMTSDDIAINSTNFKVDSDGNLECNSSTMTNSTINGGKLTLYDIGENDPSIEIYENERENSLTVNNTYNLYSVVLDTMSSGFYSGASRLARNGDVVAFTTDEYLYKYRIICQVIGNVYFERISESINNLADTHTYQIRTIWQYNELMDTSQVISFQQYSPTIINENITCTTYNTAFSVVLDKMHYDMATNILQTKIASDYILGKELMLQDSSEQNYFFMVTPTTGQIMTNCLAQFDDIFLSNSTNEIRITPSDIKKNNKSIINKSNITMGLASNVTISNTTETKISLSTISYTGSRLTATNDGGVLVGANISAIMVSGQANISSFSGNATRTFFIKRDRNGTLTNIARVNFRLNATYTGTYNTMQITPKITGVQEGDKIYLYAQHQNPSSGTSSTTIYGSGIDTYLTVQELE